MIKRAKVLLLSCLSILMLGATPYQSVDGLEFDSVQGSTKIKQFDIDFDLHVQDSGYTSSWLSSNLTATSEKLLEYAESKGYRTVECRPVGKLDVYVIDFEVLNNRKRFNKYKGAESGMPIWALFDSRDDSLDTAAIMLTDHGKKHNYKLFAHELAHYWSYRFCWDFYYSNVDGEDLANDFERYVEENR